MKHSQSLLRVIIVAMAPLVLIGCSPTPAPALPTNAQAAVPVAPTPTAATLALASATPLPAATLLPAGTSVLTATSLPTRTATLTPVLSPTATRVRPSATPAPTRPPVSTKRQTLIVPGNEPPTLDPALTGDATSHEYISEIHSGLVMLDRNLRVKPGIAERWDLSSDGKTYTFYLRKDVRFHNGRPATARDFKYSIERATDPALKSPTAGTYLGDIVGVKEKLANRATSVSGVRVIDDYTVEITIAEPRSYFLAKLTYPTSYFVDQANVEQGGRTWFNYEKGQLDVIGVGSSDIDRVSDPNNPLNKELAVSPLLETSFVVFNTRKPPFDDSKVRQAFALAIDREQIVKVAYRGLPMLANSILPPGMPGYVNPPAPVYDPVLAKQLLAQSKYAGKLPDVVWNVTGTGGSVAPALQAMAEMLKTSLGVNISIQQTEWSAFLELTRDPQRGGMRMFSIGWSADYVDPENFLDVLFRTGGENNWSLYSNPSVDDLLDQAAQEKDLETRFKLYRQAESMILADYPVIPLTHARSYTLVKPYVRDFAISPTAVSNLRYVWLSD